MLAFNAGVRLPSRVGSVVGKTSIFGQGRINQTELARFP